MTRNHIIRGSLMAALILAASIARSEGTGTPNPTPPSGQSPQGTPAQPTGEKPQGTPAPAPASPQASDPATNPASAAAASPAASPDPATLSAQGSAQSNMDAQSVLARGAQVSAPEREVADARMLAAARSADAASKTPEGQRDISGRLAADFGVTVDALMKEKQSTGQGWGSFMIAHALATESHSGLGAGQLLALHQNAGWGQIAAGLGLKLGDAVSAVRAESRVAAGMSRAEAVTAGEAELAAEAKTGEQLTVEANQASTEAQKPGGQTQVAQRLAAEFGVTAEALQKEVQESGEGWGNVMLAHSLAANLQGGPTAAGLLNLHAKGEGWGEIASDWNLKLGEVVAAAKHEDGVALGREKPDGKVAQIHSEGAHVGASTETAVSAGHAGGRNGANVGVKTGGGSSVQVRVGGRH